MDHEELIDRKLKKNNIGAALLPERWAYAREAVRDLLTQDHEEIELFKPLRSQSIKACTYLRRKCVSPPTFIYYHSAGEMIFEWQLGSDNILLSIYLDGGLEFHYTTPESSEFITFSRRRTLTKPISGNS